MQDHSESKIRVLIADDDNQTSRRLAAYIAERGFEAQVVTNGKDARAAILNWKPRFIIADLLLPEGNAIQLIDFVKTERGLRRSFIHVIVTSGHNVESNVRSCLNRGAKDYIVKPYSFEDVVKRLVFHSRSYKKLRDISTKDYSKLDEGSLMLYQTDLVMRQAMNDSSLEDKIFNLTRMASLKVNGLRCSVVHCLDQKNGVVVMSNDTRQATGLPIDLYKYPEILHVLNTQTLTAIENISDSAELRHIKDLVQDIAFNSLIVCPVSRFGKPFGVLSLRMPVDRQTLSDNEIRFVEIVGHVISLVLSNNLYKDQGDFWMVENAKVAPAIPLRKVKNS